MLDQKKRICKIKEALADYLVEKEDQSLISLETTRVLQRPFSTIVFLRVKTSKNVQRLVMKTTAHHPMNKALTESENQAKVEFNILKKLYPKFQEVEKCSVPYPILVIPELETYLMEFVEGNILSNELRYDRYFASRKGFCQLLEHFNNCGRWLKKLQEFTGIHTAGIEVFDTAIKRCEHRLRQIDESGDSRCAKGLQNRILRLLHDQMSQLSGSKILVSGRHGDFTSYNILCSPHEINVIDFLGYKEDSVSIDLISMLVHLENEKLCLTSNPRRVDALRKSFLEGFGEIPHIPRPVLIISEVLLRVMSLWGCISRSKKARLHHKIEANRCIGAHIDWLADAEEKDLISLEPI